MQHSAKRRLPAVLGLTAALLLGSCLAEEGSADRVVMAAVEADAKDGGAHGGTVSGFVEEGQASWYGAELAGAKTASGEPFDPAARTAAHPKLPFGTPVTITNLDNGKETVVIINDRGPSVDDRIIDVSQAAAQALGFKDDGTARVRIEVTAEALTEVEAGDSS